MYSIMKSLVNSARAIGTKRTRIMEGGAVERSNATRGIPSSFTTKRKTKTTDTIGSGI